MARWMSDQGINFQVVSDEDYSTVDAWNFNAIPFNVVIDRDFVIDALIRGFDPSTLESRVQNLL